ncbi:MAG: HAD family hydrolase [Melioribacteraceae bacterium]|jgi:D,D-heptose 1,7-bisphosphate phosphatase|nr:MAG: HAD family hydrolase [Ignavibacteriales bacterium]WKZ71304.1 MAG: HAD family hydrolase [Melioribacteraceae bacterium]
MSYRAVFLDRDGTINEDPGYLGDESLVKLLPGVAEGIFELKSKFGFKIIVISNQSGIARGLITHEDVKRVNGKINSLLSEQNAEIDVFYYCEFHPSFSSENDENCRKPSPKMIFKAAEENNIDLSGSYMIGDKSSDVLCGISAGVKSILLSSESISEEINSLKKVGKTPNFVASDFLNAVNFIKQDFK